MAGSRAPALLPPTPRGAFGPPGLRVALQTFAAPSDDKDLSGLVCDSPRTFRTFCEALRHARGVRALNLLGAAFPAEKAGRRSPGPLTAPMRAFLGSLGDCPSEVKEVLLDGATFGGAAAPAAFYEEIRRIGKRSKTKAIARATRIAEDARATELTLDIAERRGVAEVYVADHAARAERLRRQETRERNQVILAWRTIREAALRAAFRREFREAHIAARAELQVEETAARGVAVDVEFASRLGVLTEYAGPEGFQALRREEHAARHLLWRAMQRDWRRGHREQLIRDNTQRGDGAVVGLEERRGRAAVVTEWWSGLAAAANTFEDAVFDLRIRAHDDAERKADEQRLAFVSSRDAAAADERHTEALQLRQAAASFHLERQSMALLREHSRMVQGLEDCRAAVMSAIRALRNADDKYLARYHRYRQVHREFSAALSMLPGVHVRAPDLQPVTCVFAQAAQEDTAGPETGQCGPPVLLEGRAKVDVALPTTWALRATMLAQELREHVTGVAGAAVELITDVEAPLQQCAGVMEAVALAPPGTAPPAEARARCISAVVSGRAALGTARSSLMAFQRYVRRARPLLAADLDLEGFDPEYVRRRKETIFSGVLVAEVAPAAAGACSLSYRGEWACIGQRTPRLEITVPLGVPAATIEAEVRLIAAFATAAVTEPIRSHVELRFQLRVLRHNSYFNRAHSKRSRRCVRLPTGAPFDAEAQLAFVLAPPVLDFCHAARDVQHDARAAPYPIFAGVVVREPPSVQRSRVVHRAASPRRETRWSMLRGMTARLTPLVESKRPAEDALLIVEGPVPPYAAGGAGLVPCSSCAPPQSPRDAPLLGPYGIDGASYDQEKRPTVRLFEECTLIVEGHAVGYVTRPGRDLVLHFGSDAAVTAARIAAVLRSVHYANGLPQDPTLGTRVLRVQAESDLGVALDVVTTVCVSADDSPCEWRVPHEDILYRGLIHAATPAPLARWCPCPVVRFSEAAVLEDDDTTNFHGGWVEATIPAAELRQPAETPPPRAAASVPFDQADEPDADERGDDDLPFTGEGLFIVADAVPRGAPPASIGLCLRPYGAASPSDDDLPEASRSPHRGGTTDPRPGPRASCANDAVAAAVDAALVERTEQVRPGDDAVVRRWTLFHDGAVLGTVTATAAGAWMAAMGCHPSTELPAGSGFFGHTLRVAFAETGTATMEGAQALLRALGYRQGYPFVDSAVTKHITLRVLVGSTAGKVDVAGNPLAQDCQNPIFETQFRLRCLPSFLPLGAAYQRIPRTRASVSLTAEEASDVQRRLSLCEGSLEDAPFAASPAEAEPPMPPVPHRYWENSGPSCPWLDAAAAVAHWARLPSLGLTPPSSPRHHHRRSDAFGAPVGVPDDAGVGAGYVLFDIADGREPEDQLGVLESIDDDTEDMHRRSVLSAQSSTAPRTLVRGSRRGSVAGPKGRVERSVSVSFARSGAFDESSVAPALSLEPVQSDLGGLDLGRHRVAARRRFLGLSSSSENASPVPSPRRKSVALPRGPRRASRASVSLPGTPATPQSRGNGSPRRAAKRDAPSPASPRPALALSGWFGGIPGAERPPHAPKDDAGAALRKSTDGVVAAAQRGEGSFREVVPKAAALLAADRMRQLRARGLDDGFAAEDVTVYRVRVHGTAVGRAYIDEKGCRVCVSFTAPPTPDIIAEVYRHVVYSNHSRNPHVRRKTLRTVLSVGTAGTCSALKHLDLDLYDDPTEIDVQAPVQYFRCGATDRPLPLRPCLMGSAGNTTRRGTKAAMVVPPRLLQDERGDDAWAALAHPAPTAVPWPHAAQLFPRDSTVITDPDTEFWDGGVVEVAMAATETVPEIGTLLPQGAESRPPPPEWAKDAVAAAVPLGGHIRMRLLTAEEQRNTTHLRFGAATLGREQYLDLEELPLPTSAAGLLGDLGPGDSDLFAAIYDAWDSPFTQNDTQGVEALCSVPGSLAAALASATQLPPMAGDDSLNSSQSGASAPVPAEYTAWTVHHHEPVMCGRLRFVDDAGVETLGNIGTVAVAIRSTAELHVDGQSPRRRAGRFTLKLRAAVTLRVAFTAREPDRRLLSLPLLHRVVDALAASCQPPPFIPDEPPRRGDKRRTVATPSGYPTPHSLGLRVRLPVDQPALLRITDADNAVPGLAGMTLRCLAPVFALPPDTPAELAASVLSSPSLHPESTLSPDPSMLRWDRSGPETVDVTALALRPLRDSRSSSPRGPARGSIVAAASQVISDLHPHESHRVPYPCARTVSFSIKGAKPEPVFEHLSCRLPEGFRSPGVFEVFLQGQYSPPHDRLSLRFPANTFTLTNDGLIISGKDVVCKAVVAPHQIRLECSAKDRAATRTKIRDVLRHVCFLAGAENSKERDAIPRSHRVVVLTALVHEAGASANGAADALRDAAGRPSDPKMPCVGRNPAGQVEAYSLGVRVRVDA